MQSDIRFTVAIPTINRLPYLRNSVNAVLEQLAPYPGGQLIVVDNGSTDGTLDYLREAAAAEPRLAWRQETRRGSYHARATAIDYATGDILIVLDDDAVPQAGWLQGMIAVFEQDRKIGVVGCGVDPDWAAPPPAWLTKRHWDTLTISPGNSEPFDTRFPCFPPSIALGMRLGPCARLYAGTSRRTDYPLGRRYDSSLGRDEQLVAAEDTDLCEIYARNGFRVVMAPHIRVTHHIPASRLRRDWFRDKFRSDGMTRVRLLRATGRPVLGRHGWMFFVSFPVFWPLAVLVRPLPYGTAVAYITALAAKGRGAWREFLFGAKITPLSYELDRPGK